MQYLHTHVFELAFNVSITFCFLIFKKNCKYGMLFLTGSGQVGSTMPLQEQQFTFMIIDHQGLIDQIAKGLSSSKSDPA